MGEGVGVEVLIVFRKERGSDEVRRVGMGLSND